jgi:transaldolase
MKKLSEVPIKIFADGADKEGIVKLYQDPFIQGMTTNPTLMRKVGISDYEKFAREVLQVVKTKPISFEVFSDDFEDMHRQALKISKWQDNVYVKIPITNTKGESALPLIRKLTGGGVRVNVTAILTLDQVKGVATHLEPQVPAVVSIFAGRIADTGVDPVPAIKQSLEILKALPKAEVLWASVREVLNIFQAAESGAHIVTVTHDVLAKAQKMAGMDLGELSLDTVKMFYNDAQAAGFKL